MFFWFHFLVSKQPALLRTQECPYQLKAKSCTAQYLISENCQKWRLWEKIQEHLLPPIPLAN